MLRKTKRLQMMLFMVIAVALAASLIGCNNDTPPTTEPTDAPTVAATTLPPVAPEDRIYWNIDRELYSTIKNRAADPDTGLFSLRLTADGEIFEYQTAKGDLFMYIDEESVLALTFDDDGLIFGMKDLSKLIGGVAVNNQYVESVDGMTCVLSGKGSVTLNEQTKVYDVTGINGQVGMPAQIQPGDCIYAVKDKSGEVSLVYITDHKVAHDDTHECAACKKAVTWTAWDGESELADGGHYYLAENVNVQNAIELAGKNVTLCLNRRTYKCDDCALVISQGGHMNIVDHVGYDGHYKGQFKGSGYNAKTPSYEAMEGGTVRIMDRESSLSIYGGNVMTELPADGSRSVLYGGTIHSFGTLNLYDGYVTGCEVVGTGGAVYLDDEAVLNMSGGALQYGSALTSTETTEHKTGRGGTLYVKKTASKVNILDGTVIAGYAQYAGGGIYTELSFDLTAGTFMGDLTAGDNAEYGGVLAVGSPAVVNIKENVTFYGGHAIEGGHLSCHHGATVNIYDGATFRNGYASRNGGNIASFGVVNIFGGEIKNGTAASGGGNLYSFTNGTTETHMYGGEISGGTAARGGNIVLSSGRQGKDPARLFIYGGVIKDGTATDGKGGNIDLRRDAYMYMTGGEITGGDGGGIGDGVFTESVESEYPDLHVVVELGGSARITGNGSKDLMMNIGSELFLVKDKPFTENALIGVDLINFMLPLIADAPTDVTSAFRCQTEGCKIVWENGQILVKFGA